jgi:hypothetical protein
MGPTRGCRRVPGKDARDGVSAAERNHSVAFGVPRCSRKNGKSDLQVTLAALSRPPVQTVLWRGCCTARASTAARGFPGEGPTAWWRAGLLPPFFLLYYRIVPVRCYRLFKIFNMENAWYYVHIIHFLRLSKIHDINFYITIFKMSTTYNIEKNFSSSGHTRTQT